MSGYGGRQTQYDFTITNDSVDYPFTVLRRNGEVAWDAARVPDVAGYEQSPQSVPKAYRSTHMGFGWGQAQAENVYHYAVNSDPRFPQSVILGPQVHSLTLSGTGRTAVTGFFEMSTNLFAIAGKWLNKIAPNATPSSDAVTVTGIYPYDLSTSNTSAVGTMGQNFDGNTIIGVTTGSGASMLSFDGTNAPTVLNDTTLVGALALPKGAYLVRYMGDDDWELAVACLISSNPSISWIAQGATLNNADNWVGVGTGDTYGVGDRSASLTGIANVDQLIFVGMTDGLYALDGRSGRAPQVLAAIPRDANNGINMMADQSGLVWYPAKSGLYLFDPVSGTIDDVSPGRMLPNRSGIVGLYTAETQFRAWTFVSVYDGTDSYIMCGRRREEGEPGYGPYIWHGALAKIASDKVTAMHVSSLVAPPRLWLGLNSGDVKSILLPSNGDNPLNDSNYLYATWGQMYYPADDIGTGGMRWQLQDVVIETENLTTVTSDTFTRADSSSSLGNATTGETWTAHTGTWGISSNRGYSVTYTDGDYATLDSGAVDGWFEIDVVSDIYGTRAPQFIVRGIDTNNHLLIDPGSTTIKLYKKDGGNYTELVSAAYTFTNATTYTIGVSCCSTHVQVFVDGVRQIDHTLATANAKYAGATATRVGMRHGGETGAGLFWDNLNVVSMIQVYERRDLGTWTLLDTVTSAGRSVITPTGDKRFNRLELRLDFGNATTASTPVVRSLSAQCLPRPTMRDLITTTVILDDNELSNLEQSPRYAAQDLLTQLKTYDSGPPYTLKENWTGSEASSTVQVISVHPRIVKQKGDEPAVFVADLTMKIIA